MCGHEPKIAKGMCQRCYDAKYYQQHKIKKAVQSAEYYRTHQTEIAEQTAGYRQTHKVERIKYTQIHKIKIAKQTAEYYRLHKLEIAERTADYQRVHKTEMVEYRQIHKVERIAYNARYQQTHRAEKAKYVQTKRKTDPQYDMARRLRTRLGGAIKNKSASTKELTGCEWQFLVAYLESKFTSGMTWENRNQWHIDHIKPLSKFDLTDPEQQRVACHYTNLQPLWAKDNLIKGSQ